MRITIKQLFGVFLFVPMSCSALNIKDGEIPIQVGVFTSSPGTTQNINIQDLIGNNYTVDNHHSTNALFGIGYFIKGQDNNLHQLMFGINGFYFGNSSVRGNIVQEHLFTNLNYHYTIRHLPVYLAAKAKIKNESNKYNVTLDAGIGPNFMKTSHYGESSLNGYTIPDNAFLGHNDSVFSAMAGIGLRLNNVLGKFPLECGYRFFYLGQGQLDTNNNQILNRIKTGDTYANALLCSVVV